ncbi:MAG: hypothetical protein IKW83_01065 [Muribaculaceae bacterium]|nr:hypothetical protein [Muribaculaceae bacterium]
MKKILTFVLLACCVLCVDARRKSDRECEKEMEAVMADALLPLEQASNDVFEPNSTMEWRYGFDHCRIKSFNNEQGEPDHLGFMLEDTWEWNEGNNIYKVKLIDGKPVVINRPGFTASHLVAGQWDIIVFQDEKEQVHDVLLKCKEHNPYSYKKEENGDMQDMFAGVWVNDSDAVTEFGYIFKTDNRWRHVAPGNEYEIRGYRNRDDNSRQLKLVFVEERVKGAGSVMMGGGINGGGGHGSQHGPIIWWIKDTEGNLSVELDKPYDEELDDYYSKFRDPQFALQWVRSPYLDRNERWTVLSMRPVTRGMLEFFDKMSQQQMLNYLNTRENPTDIEKLNKSLINTVLND